MQAIREIIEIKSNRFTFDLPADFTSKKVEVIIMPYEAEKKIKKNDFFDLAEKINIDELAFSQLRKNSVI